MDLSAPEVPNVTPADNPPVLQPDDPEEALGTPEGPFTDSAPPPVPGAVQELLDDINQAPEMPVPDFQIPPGSFESKVSLLTLQWINENNRVAGRSPQKRLRILHHLGELRATAPIEFNSITKRNIGRSQRDRLSRLIKRLCLITRRIGLARLYGTEVLTPNRLDKITDPDFKSHLLPGIRTTSEDLALEDRGGVTSPGSPAAVDWEWQPDNDHLEHSNVPGSPWVYSP